MASAIYVGYLVRVSFPVFRDKSTMAEPTPSPNAISFAPPPPGLNYIAAIQPFLSLLLIHAVFGAILIPIICVLFTLSTANLRKTPIFLANVLSILAGMLLAWLGSVDQVSIGSIGDCKCSRRLTSHLYRYKQSWIP